MAGNELHNINLLGFCFTFFTCILMLFLPKRYAFVPIIMIGCFITLGQVFLVAGLNFTMMRIIVLFGWIRILFRREMDNIKFNKIDLALFLWVLSNFTLSIIREMDMNTLINRLGFAFNAFGMYFLFRYILVNLKDLENVIKVFAIFVIPLAIFMTVEKISGKNIFSVFGGVPEITDMRGGQYRAQGPFQHAILAGTFAVTLLPMVISLWFKGNKQSKLCILGCVSIIVMVITSSSSGPMVSLIISLIATLAWKYRKYMKIVRWGIVFCIILLHIVMKAPVWALVGRMSEIFGGTGYHRVEIIDSAIIYFNEWWLVGTNSTAHWGLTMISGIEADITNQYIGEGIQGGLLTMLLFIYLLSRCFSVIGNSIRHFENHPFHDNILIWSLGASLLAHVVSFISVSYFDQMIMFFYLLLAMISTLTRFMDIKDINNNIYSINSGLNYC